MRRGPLLVTSIVALGVLLTGLAVFLRPSEGTPSIVLVTIDTFRADRFGAGSTGAPGADSLTPHLDALAARGVVFETAWTTAPLTVPAHATMLTGLVPPAHGLRTNFPSGPLPPANAREWATLAERLRGAGCRTGAFTSASVLRKERTGLDAGFDVYDEVEAARPGSPHDVERVGGETVRAALSWVRESQGPVFLWVHLFDPHFPYDAPKTFSRATPGAPPSAHYDDEIRYADHCLGLLLEGLEQAGHGDAIVAVTSDHGEGLGEHGEASHGYLLHEATLHVPLVLAAPGRLGEGERRPEEVSLRELAPTLLTLARLPVDAETLLKRSTSPQGFLYAETHYGHESFGWAQLLALRRQGTKLVDTGREIWAYDLAADPQELAPEVVPPGDERAELVRRAIENVAARPPLSALGPDSSALGTIPYVAPALGGGARLSTEENARLPNPYERIDVVTGFSRALTLARMGRIEEALAEYAALALRDPGNPQVPFWRARALTSPPLPDFLAAFESFVHAFELGDRRPAVISLAILAGINTHDPATLQRAHDLLVAARGRGTREDTDLLSAAAALCVGLARFDEARELVDRLRAAPQNDQSRRALPQLEEALRNAPPK